MIVTINTATETPQMYRYLAAANVAGSPVILLEDGVYQIYKLASLCSTLKVRQLDAEQRGVQVEDAALLTDSEIVALIEQHGKQVVVR